MLNVFSGKTVLVTGHTGFKGSWLSIWLKMLGAKVVGLALDPNTIPSHFDAALLKDELIDYRVDIRSSKMISDIINDINYPIFEKNSDKFSQTCPNNLRAFLLYHR